MAHRVLVLGAGLVARPLVRYLLDREGFEVTVATRTVKKAEAIVAGHPRGRAVAVDVTSKEAMRPLVEKADLAVSLVPYAHHVQVAELCLERKIDMVTTSYVSPPMRALDARAREAGIIILNECGLDPGIDHMSAMRVIHAVKTAGGKVTEFRSICSGLPTPKTNTNP